ncbi:uncharacterized protein LTR77_010930 [Saxophila tyrrhenica]|uniref:Carbohydrate-binding module family 19 domain-containing protein n=1 Tax=Saxophila tyrrhenica TaxID=1690608 RepID=A0AAV9NU13_9PEZI|nr:hypothetical protein LTR77_010930 [Saxophila tyrrhenica]
MLCHALLTAALVAGAASKPITARSGTCQTEGALLCNADGSKFAICSWGQAVFQDVAAGTLCVCTAHDSELCTIAAADSQPPTAPAPPPSRPPPVPTSKPAPPAPSHPAPAPKPAPPAHSGGASHYTTFLGNGSPSQGWPTVSDWQSFDDLWTANVETMKSSCAQFDQEDNSPEEIADLRAAILSESRSAGVDPRFALATMMQESDGCVRVWSTNYGVNNPGLFQSHNGQGSCFNRTPCPKSEIVQMVKDGVSGTADGPLLKGVIAQAEDEGDDGVQAMYAGLRMYNSGSVAASGNLEDGIATHCYFSDIANRLTGWSEGSTGCTLDA